MNSLGGLTSVGPDSLWGIPGKLCWGWSGSRNNIVRHRSRWSACLPVPTWDEHPSTFMVIAGPIQGTSPFVMGISAISRSDIHSEPLLQGRWSTTPWQSPYRRALGAWGGQTCGLCGTDHGGFHTIQATNLGVWGQPCFLSIRKWHWRWWYEFVQTSGFVTSSFSKEMMISHARILGLGPRFLTCSFFSRFCRKNWKFFLSPL